MLTRLKNHLNPAMIIAFIALFAAMGGTALALGTASVRSIHIKNGEVKRQDLASGAVTSSRIRDNIIRSKDIKDGQITSSDVASDAFETPGDRPNTTVTTRTGSLTVTSKAETGLTVTCDSDEIVIGGGWGNESNATEDLDEGNTVTENRRDGNGWRVVVQDNSTSGDGDSITVRADCAKIS